MKKYKVSIGTPCSENWSTMTQTEQGRHCASCDKTVIDFTKMSNNDIVQYLLSNKGERVCGNFIQHQIQSPLIIQTTKKVNAWPSVVAMVLAGVFHFHPVQSQIHNNSVKEYQTIADKDLKRETEPGSDSSKVYTLTILSGETNQPVPMAKVSIKSLGDFITDDKGNVKVNWENKKLPQIIYIDISANGFEYASFHIKSSEIISTRQFTLHLNGIKTDMLRGDVSIEEVR